MDPNRSVRRFCAVVILYALLFRFFSAGSPEILGRWLCKPNIQRFLTHLETGRIVRFSSSEAVWPAFSRESPPPALPRADKLTFSPEESAEIGVTRLCALQPDLSSLLTAPLDWDLTGQLPTVLITHTHGTESYTKNGENYRETAAYRTLEEEFNMLGIGSRVAEILEEEGICVLQDRTLHDYPSYNGSYTHARKTIQEILEENPSIRLILDLHRDASGTADSQLRTEVTVQGKSCAQLMLVIGTDAGGLAHKNWQENLSLALKLYVLLEKQVPGIMRPVSLRAQRFNQDLSPGALLVEVGAAGNTRQEALQAAEFLARAIAKLAKGSQ